MEGLALAVTVLLGMVYFGAGCALAFAYLSRKDPDGTQFGATAFAFLLFMGWPLVLIWEAVRDLFHR